MFIDLCAPDGNEQEFLKTAQSLGTKGLCFCYIVGKREELDKKRKLINELQAKTKIKLYLGAIAKPAEGKKLRAHCDLLIAPSQPENRDPLERKEFDILFGLEDNPRKDPMHYRNSGMNQVLGTSSKESQVAIGIPFYDILINDSQRRATIMGRIMQNIRICKKTRANMMIASFASKPLQLRAGPDLRSVCIALGMEPGDANRAISFAALRIQENALIKEGKFYGDGVSVEDIIKEK